MNASLLSGCSHLSPQSKLNQNHSLPEIPIKIFSKPQRKHCAIDAICDHYQKPKTKTSSLSKKNTPHNVFSLEGGTVRAGGRGDGILRWDLPRSGQARISCITDRCSRRYALVNLWLQLYLARTPLCLPWPSSCLVLPTRPF